MQLTDFQEACLLMIEREIKATPAYAWMRPSYVMAIIQEESNWRKDVLSADGLGSIGLMQPLPATVTAAREAGLQVSSMHDPNDNIRVGMWCLNEKHAYLARHLGASLTLDHVVAAYNEGEGNVLKGRSDQAYVDRFHRYQAMFAFVDKVMTGPVKMSGAVSVAPSQEPAPVATVAPPAPPAPVQPESQEDSGSADDLNRQELETLTRLNPLP